MRRVWIRLMAIALPLALIGVCVVLTPRAREQAYVAYAKGYWQRMHPGTFTPAVADPVQAQLLTQLPVGVSTLTPETLGMLKTVDLSYIWIDNPDISPIRFCTSATKVSLVNLQLKRDDLKPVATLLNVTDLDLSNPPPPRSCWWIPPDEPIDLAPLAGLIHLKKLDLTDRSLNDLSPLAGLTQLEELDLGFRRGVDLSPLRSLDHLRVLKLQYFGPDQSFRGLAGMKGLEEVDLAWAGDVSNKLNLTGLESVLSLRTLNVSMCPIAGLAPLSRHPHLETLVINECDFSDLSALTECPHLKSVKVSRHGTWTAADERAKVALQSRGVQVERRSGG